MSDYISQFTGAQVDEAVDAVLENKSTWDTVTDKADAADLNALASEVGELANEVGNIASDEIVDALNSDATDKVLSARQGMLLKSAVLRVQTNLETLVTKLANLAFGNSRPTFTDPFSEQAIPQLSLFSDGNAVGNTLSFGVASTGTVTKTILVQGTNLTMPLTVSLGGSNPGSFSIQPTTISAASANGGASLTVVWAPTFTGPYSATLTITSSEITKTVRMSADKSSGQEGGDSPSGNEVNIAVTGTFNNCAIEGVVPSQVLSGDDLNIVIVPNSGYTLSGVTISPTVNGTGKSGTLDTSTGKYTLALTNITADTTIAFGTVTAVSQPITLKYGYSLHSSANEVTTSGSCYIETFLDVPSEATYLRWKSGWTTNQGDTKNCLICYKADMTKAGKKASSSNTSGIFLIQKTTSGNFPTTTKYVRASFNVSQLANCYLEYTTDTQVNGEDISSSNMDGANWVTLFNGTTSNYNNQ